MCGPLVSLYVITTLIMLDLNHLLTHSWDTDHCHSVEYHQAEKYVPNSAPAQAVTILHCVYYCLVLNSAQSIFDF